MPASTSLSQAERDRLAVLEEYQILDTEPEDAFTDLARLAAQLCNTPTALIGFVDARRVWVKAHVGDVFPEMPRERAMCERVVRAGRAVTVEDLSEDPEFHDHPLVTGDPGVRFYAGIPLIGRKGLVVGTLCVMAPERRSLEPDQRSGLEVLGRQVVTQLDLRRNLRGMQDLVREHEQAEADLAVAERQFRGIFENSTEGIFQTTPEGAYRIANPRLAQIYGYDTKEELMKAVRRIGHQLYVKPGRRAEFERLLQAGNEVVGFESEVFRRDGRRIWISENARAVHDRDGRLLYYEGTVVDITARKRAEQRLRDSELLYHSLVESLSHNIFRKDLEGRFTFVNSTFAQTLGRPVEEIIGRTDRDFFPEVLASAYQADDRQVVRSGVPVEKVEKHRKADGTVLYVHVLKSPLQDAHGRAVGVQGIFWDETERHEMEERLAYERDLLRALLDTVPDAIYFKDRESRFLRCSQEMARRVGVASTEELLGKTDFDLFSGEHAQQAFDDEQEIIRTGQPILGKPEKETWRSGRETWVLTTKMPFRDHEGNIIGTLGISKDITKLIEIEKELEKARDEALESTRLKNVLLGNISHELRTPLHTIIAGADVLEQTRLGSEQRELLTAMRRQAEWQLHMINDLIEISRGDTASLKLECHDFDPEEIAWDVVERLAESALHKRIELIGDIAPQLPRLSGDPIRIQQVLINLIANAIKFTEHGHVRLRLTALEQADWSVRLRAEIEDTGIGLVEEVRERIFEAFVQADASTTRRYGGTGLGLAICRQLVRLMGGDIQVESEVGKGSRFSFELSLPKASSPGQQAPEGGALDGFRVLLVEDHPVASAVLERWLTGWGAVVTLAGSAREADERVAEAAESGGPFQAVLVDETLPDEPGKALATRFASAPDGPPVLLMASMTARLELAGQAEAGRLRCLPKPSPPGRLHRVLLAWRRGHSDTVHLPAPDGPVTRRGLRVLVAEDNDFNRDIAVQQLQLLGHRPTAVADGRQVLTALEQGCYDAVLLDCQMPELDGYATARAIREREGEQAAKGSTAHRMHIIAVTANTSEEDRQRCLSAGMDDFLSKPVVRAKLDAALRSVGGEVAEEAPAAPEASAATAATGQAETSVGAAVSLDPATLRSFDAGSAKDLVELFIRTAGELSARLQRAAEVQDAKELQSAAHSLKGSSRHIGAKRLGELCAEAESLAKEGKIVEAAAAIAGITAEREKVERLLRTEIAGSTEATGSGFDKGPTR